MFVLQLNKTERDYLLSVLKKQRGLTSKQLLSQLRDADDVFGIAMWADDDIRTKLQEYEIPDTPQNIEAIRRSYYARHIDDLMVESGWTVLEHAVSELEADLARNA